MQYGIRLSQTEMDWGEFCRLLHGIMPETPLGSIVMIRSEEDKERLKSFTPEQKRIRDEWRNKHSSIEHMSEAQKAEAARQVQEIFRNMFK